MVSAVMPEWPKPYVTSQDGFSYDWIPGGAVSVNQGAEARRDRTAKQVEGQLAAMTPEQRVSTAICGREAPRYAAEHRVELSTRSAVVDLHADRHRRRPLHLCVCHRLHAWRDRVLSLLRLHGPVHVCDARAGDGLELPDDVCRLGRRGSLFVPADRLLLRSPGSRQRFTQGIHNQSRRRLWLCARNLRRHRDFRQRAVHRRL